MCLLESVAGKNVLSLHCGYIALKLRLWLLQIVARKNVLSLHCGYIALKLRLWLL